MNLNFQKGYVVSGKSTFFVLDPFCTPHSICLNPLMPGGNKKVTHS